MILGPVSYVDCIVFCIFLAPQLFYHVGLIGTVICVLQAIPFLIFKLPYTFIRDRFWRSTASKPLWLSQASAFEDFVIRCVRYAFANIDPRIGRVFFSKWVALPFLRFRMLRHGYFKAPIHWHEYTDKKFKGLWVIRDPIKEPDIVIFYAHGGGFLMGSPYFYLEFLLSWIAVLVNAGHTNPAIFALDYTLVPDAVYPRQVDEAVHAYEHVMSFARDPAKVIVSGDSAGATIILSLLLHIARTAESAEVDTSAVRKLPQPGLAAFISPWIALTSSRHQQTESDYLDAETLTIYASQYAGVQGRPNDPRMREPLISPGNCKDLNWWRRASPPGGIVITYGEEEVFAAESRAWIDMLRKGGVAVEGIAEKGGIHAWPVASLFLCESIGLRLRGLENIVEHIDRHMKRRLEDGK